MLLPADAIVLGLILLQVKHFFGDFVLQSERQAHLKGFYGHRAGLGHAAVHAALSLPCLLLVGVPLGATTAAAGVEWIIHYHQDWLRAAITRRLGLTQADRLYWILLGEDQLVHQVTYLGMVWVLL